MGIILRARLKQATLCRVKRRLRANGQEAFAVPFAFLNDHDGGDE